MTDYDEIRTCCSGKGICKRCWGFIAVAVKVLDKSLRSHFGYQHLLWVYSGRRGIHCWVSDEEALNLTDDQRKAIMGWLEVIKGGKDMVKKVNVRLAGGPLHHSLRYVLQRGCYHFYSDLLLRDALAILRSSFENLILRDQDCFLTEEKADVLLELLDDSEIVTNLRKKWLKGSVRSSQEKWADVKSEVISIAKAKGIAPDKSVSALLNIFHVGSNSNKLQSFSRCLKRWRILFCNTHTLGSTLQCQSTEIICSSRLSVSIQVLDESVFRSTH